MLRQHIIVLFLCIGLLALPASVCAQEKYFGKAGTVELAGGISFSSFTPVSNGHTGDATTLFSIGPEIGVFAVDGFELGFNPGVSLLLLPGVSIESPAHGSSTTALQLFFYPAYNFHLEGSQATPFLELPFGYTSMSSGNATESGFSWGLKGGVKLNPAGHLIITISAEYLLLTFNPENAKERNGLNYLAVGVAVGGFL